MTESVLAASHAAPRLLAALIPVLVLMAGFDVYCLADLVRARAVRHLPKLVWALIVLASCPIGGLLYLFLGRNRDAQEPAQ